MTGVEVYNPENPRLAPGAEAKFEAVYRAPATVNELELHDVHPHLVRQRGRCGIVEFRGPRNRGGLPRGLNFPAPGRGFLPGFAVSGQIRGVYIRGAAADFFGNLR